MDLLLNAHPTDFVGLLPCLALLSLSVSSNLFFRILLELMLNIYIGRFHSGSVYIDRSHREVSALELGTLV